MKISRQLDLAVSHNSPESDTRGLKFRKSNFEERPENLRAAIKLGGAPRGSSKIEVVYSSHFLEKIPFGTNLRVGAIFRGVNFPEIKNDIKF